MMNPEAQAELDRILALEPAALTEDDQAFLMARRSYLPEEQRIKFGITEPEAAPASTEGEEAPVRRGRRASTEE
jgi:hypothetical protein